MRKCSILFVRSDTGERYWGLSVSHNGCTYALHPATESQPSNHHEAQMWYGKYRNQQAQKQIENNKKHMSWPGYSMSIVEFDSEPEWYFELFYAISHMFGDKPNSEVRKRFPLDSGIEYQIRAGHTRPIISDLSLEELQRYYDWRKRHYKGKLRTI